MDVKSCYTIYHRVILLLLLPFLPEAALASSTNNIDVKRAIVTMRMIGDEILKCMGDSNSRVMPVEYIDGHYKIPFEYEFGIDPEDIIIIVDRVMEETGTATKYLVEVEQCKTEEIVHSFIIREGINPDVIACKGRVLPKDCYNILVTLMEKDKVVILPNKADTPLSATFITVFLLIFLAGLVFLLKGNNLRHLESKIIRIGTSHFDQDKLTLTIGDNVISLSNKEAELLALLSTSANEPLEREDILKNVWGDDGSYVGRTLDVFISKLRKKLELDPTIRIVNLRGVGYKLITNIG